LPESRRLNRVSRALSHRRSSVYHELPSKEETVSLAIGTPDPSQNQNFPQRIVRGSSGSCGPKSAGTFLRKDGDIVSKGERERFPYEGSEEKGEGRVKEATKRAAPRTSPNQGRDVPVPNRVVRGEGRSSLLNNKKRKFPCSKRQRLTKDRVYVGGEGICAEKRSREGRESNATSGEKVEDSVRNSSLKERVGTIKRKPPRKRGILHMEGGFGEGGIKRIG